MLQLRPDQLVSHIKKQGLASLYLVYGDEPLLQQEALDFLRETARTQGFEEREIWTVEAGFNWAEYSNIGQSLSLFAERRVIDVRIPNGKPGTEGAKRLEQIASSLQEDTLILISLPRMDKAAQNSKWFQSLQKAAVSIPVYPLERHQLPSWLISRLKKQDLDIETNAAEWLADCVEGNLLAAQQEVMKLSLLFKAGELLSLESVQNAVMNVAHFDILHWRYAFLQMDFLRYRAILQGLQAEGESPVLLVWALGEEIRALWQLGIAKQRGENITNTLRTLRIWGERQQLLPQALSQVKAKNLRQALIALQQIDRTIKGLEQASVWLLLEKIFFTVYAKA